MEKTRLKYTHFRTGLAVPVNLPAEAKIFICNGICFPINKVIKSLFIVVIPKRPKDGYTGRAFFLELSHALSFCRIKPNTRKTIIFPKQQKQIRGEQELFKWFPLNEKTFNAHMQFNMCRTISTANEGSSSHDENGYRKVISMLKIGALISKRNIDSSSSEH